MAIAVDNLADAESLTEADKEKEEEKEKAKALRRSASKSPVDDEKQVCGTSCSQELRVRVNRSEREIKIIYSILTLTFSHNIPKKGFVYAGCSGRTY